MATFAKVNDWILNLHNDATIDINADTLQFKLTNTVPGSESSPPLADGNGIAANATDISYTNYEDDLAVDRVELVDVQPADVFLRDRLSDDRVSLCHAPSAGHLSFG